MRLLKSIRAIGLIGLFLLSGTTALLAQSEEENGAYLAEAIDAAGRGDWDNAAALARRVSDPVAVQIITWMHLRKGGVDWPQYTAFLRRNPDWPGLGGLRIKGESAIPKDADPAAVFAYFKAQRPQTGTGILRLTEAYRAVGKMKAAKKEAIRAWLTFGMTRDERVQLMARFAKTLKPLSQRRLDMLLWRGLGKQAEAIYSLVPKGYVKLAKARSALRRKKRGVTALIAAVPAGLRDDPGLAYERFLWRSRKGLYDSARDLMIQRSTSAKKLGKPEKWARLRRSIARQEMRNGNNKRAYRIAANHFLKSGPDYADLEWLAGYIALRKLKKPDLALTHFDRFRAAIATPISYGRAGYWQGRAYEAMGDKTRARAAYEFAARYQTSFYGQLAAEKIGAPPDATLTGREKIPDWRTAAFANSPLIRAALLLHYADQPASSEKFFRRVSSHLDATGIQQLADLALEIGRPNIAVRLSKKAARQGHILVRSYFPLTDLVKTRLRIKPEVAMAIARRESELDQYIISPAGARGLMQVMPKTARKVARELGITYSKDKLTSDWKYNALIGSTYLADQLKAFNGSYILAFAAYNAGPSQARKWIKKFGDPRKDSVNQVDWIEDIPFRETRNYVMRAVESLHVYRARIRGVTPRLTISKDLKKG